MAEKTLPVTVYFDVGLRQIKERFSIDKNGLKSGTLARTWFIIITTSNRVALG